VPSSDLSKAAKNINNKFNYQFFVELIGFPNRPSRFPDGQLLAGSTLSWMAALGSFQPVATGKKRPKVESNNSDLTANCDDLRLDIHRRGYAYIRQQAMAKRAHAHADRLLTT
jgi:hypothetical protein